MARATIWTIEFFPNKNRVQVGSFKAILKYSDDDEIIYDELKKLDGNTDKSDLQSWINDLRGRQAIIISEYESKNTRIANMVDQANNYINR